MGRRDESIEKRTPISFFPSIYDEGVMGGAGIFTLWRRAGLMMLVRFQRLGMLPCKGRCDVLVTREVQNGGGGWWMLGEGGDGLVAVSTGNFPGGSLFWSQNRLHRGISIIYPFHTAAQLRLVAMLRED